MGDPAGAAADFSEANRLATVAGPDTQPRGVPRPSHGRKAGPMGKGKSMGQEVSPKVAELSKRGLELQQKGDFKGAIATYDQANVPVHEAVALVLAGNDSVDNGNVGESRCLG